MNHKSALHYKTYNRRAQVSFVLALPESLDSRIRGNDVRVVTLKVQSTSRLPSGTYLGELTPVFADSSRAF